MTTPRRRRGRPPTTGLSFERIVEAALVLLDSEGFESLTTSRLSKELKVGEKTLYGYIRTKEEILDAVGDSLIAQLQIPEYDHDRDWADQVVEQFVAMHRLLTDHPAAGALFATRHVVGPGTAGLLERLLTLIGHGGLSCAEAVALYRVLMSYAVGYSIYTHGHHQPDRERRWNSYLYGLPKEDFPTLYASLTDMSTPPEPQLFESGLRVLITTRRPIAT